MAGLVTSVKHHRPEQILAAFLSIVPIIGITTAALIPLYAWIDYFLSGFIIDNTIVAGRPLRLVGSFASLCLIYLKGMLLSAVTLGIYYPWFICEILRWKADNTRSL